MEEGSGIFVNSDGILVTQTKTFSRARLDEQGLC
jgi:hypothetical protein